MNNEPVAWMSASGSFNKKETWIFHIPLYTHPAKTWQGLTAEEIATITNDEFRLQKVEKILKERNTHPAKTLTDDEIKQVWQANLVAMGNDLDFARAILRKAQEK